jgi:hypothetical protein
VFGLSGICLSFPEALQDFADRLEPPTSTNAGVRLVDQVITGSPTCTSAHSRHRDSLFGLACGDVCDQRDHVVEPRAAPPAGKRRPVRSRVVIAS